MIKLNMVKFGIKCNIVTKFVTNFAIRYNEKFLLHLCIKL